MKTFELEENMKKESMAGVSECPVSLAGTLSKRLFDILLSGGGILFWAPTFLVIWILIKMEDGGSAIFKQERIGYHGKPFTIYKFRSMRMTAEKGGKPQLCQEDDQRLTRVGKFIRQHHLDELPQLWNILKGDMSFVGPRPERKYFIDQISAINPQYSMLYKLRPGVFSNATLYNGYTDTMEKMLERLRMDLDYLAHRTFTLDMQIIFKTVYFILSGKKF